VELTGESLIAAPRSAVWAALNDPDVLARCIDGIETLTRATGADDHVRFEGRMNARVGPVRASFAGGVTLTEVDAPNRYVLIGEGKGGVAGFAKGTATVTLVDIEIDGRPGTRLGYTVVSTVGGKLAQLGARLIEGTARGYAEAFFARLRAEVEVPEKSMPERALPPAAADGLPTGEPVKEDHSLPATADVPADDDVARRGGSQASGLAPLAWAGALIAIVLGILLWQLA